MGCRNTVFNAKAQSAGRDIAPLANAGFGWFRIELVDEPASFVPQILNRYKDVIEDQTSSQSLWKWLQTIPDANGRAQGVTEGSLEMSVERSRADMKPTSNHIKQRKNRK